MSEVELKGTDGNTFITFKQSGEWVELEFAPDISANSSRTINEHYREAWHLLGRTREELSRVPHFWPVLPEVGTFVVSISGFGRESSADTK